MSTRDRAILSDLAMSSSEIARVLDISRQAVSRGVRSKSNYLNLDNLLAVYARIDPTDKDKQRRFTEVIQRHYPEIMHMLQAIAGSDQANDIAELPADGDGRELWILCADFLAFTAEHPEASRLVHRAMDNSKNVISFFSLPTAPVNKLYKYLAQIERRRHNNQSLAELHVFPCPLVEFTPFLIILNPMSDHPQCVTLGSNESFYFISSVEARRITEAIRQYDSVGVLSSTTGELDSEMESAKADMFLIPMYTSLEAMVLARRR
jgi:predicted DNA-binding protein YlxM (UPF0122 family)